MKRKIFYGVAPHLTDSDRAMFSHNGYRCEALFQNRRGIPVAVSRSADPGSVIWKVEYGFSCVLFGTQEEAMAYCRERFLGLDGRPLPAKGVAANV